MKIKRASLLAGFLTVVSLTSVSAISASAQAAAGGIPVTPPAPVFTDAQRQDELAKRRDAVRAKMGSGSMMVLLSGEPRIYSNSVDYYYRQENNLYYLTSLKQEKATLVLLPDNGMMREVLFIPKRNPAYETWEGRMYSKEDARRISGIQTVLFNEELEAFLDKTKSKKPFVSKEGESVFNTNTAFGQATGETKLFMLLPSTDGDTNGKREFYQEKEMADQWRFAGSYRIENARPMFGELRHVKSPYELKILQHAVDISTEAHMRSWAMIGRAKWEYEVQAEVEYIFRRRNADYWGYPSIVGCGPNATTLHYVTSQDPVKVGDLMLMDVGAEYDHYTADITRTFPVNGKFTPAQREIYEAVYAAQEAVAAVTKPGNKMSDIEGASANSIEASLAKMGLITGVGAIIPGTEDVKRPSRSGGITNGVPQYTIWFMHGNSHWLGMNVHDVGAYGALLKPGMVFTNEPGIYVREDALDYFKDSEAMRAFISKIRPAFEKYKNIGVRIEDDLLVTQTGVEWMTKKLPRTVREIEAFMARNSAKQLTFGGNYNDQDMRNVLFADTGLVEQNSWSPFATNEIPSGITMRSGWVSSGKSAADSGLHKHNETE